MKTKVFLLSTLMGILFSISALAQFADPALGGADYAPDPMTVGGTSTLTFNWSNSGSSTIPAGSVEILISFPNNFYATDGATPPSGAYASNFTWTHETTAGGDSWRGISNTPISAFDGGQMQLTVTGIQVTSAPEITTIFTQPISDFGSFANAPGNDNLTPAAEVEEGTSCSVEAGTLSY